MNRSKLVLLAIILLATFLRFYQLGVNPSSLSWDEAALGYNAYSIGETGRDEFGRFLPYDYFASFGDYKPPAYVYAAVLPVKIFGLNEFAVRFPSAFFGILAVLLTYFLVQELFPRFKKFSIFNFQFSIGEIAAFFLAISPWHIQMSRAAFEANLASFFVILGVMLLVRAVNKRKGILLALSAISFVITFYTFNSTRVFTPLLVLGLSFYYRQELLKIKKWLMVAMIVAALMTAPLLPHLLSAEGRLRFKEVNIFSDLRVINTTNQWMAQDQNAWWSRIIHNRRLSYALLFFEHYFHHFEGKFLFISGDGNPKFSIQEVGELYLFDLPFLLAGIYFLIKRKEKAAFPIFWWLLIAPLPAATARETPHALRILDSLPTWQIIAAYGFYVFLQEIQKREALVKKSLLFAASFFLFVNVFYYLHNYYVHYPSQYSGEWQYGYKEAVQTVSAIEENYQKVIVTEALGRPYIYLLFYKKYLPQKFWQSSQVKKEPLGFINVAGFDKYEFREVEWDKEEKGNNLYVTLTKDVPNGARIHKTINLLNGEPILTIFD